MPRLVDHTARREELAEAVWRVIRRDGLERASVRNVAREAGRSPGSLRHFFTTQSELMAFSMRLVAERARARLESRRPSGDVRRDVEGLIAEVLPLDAERRTEAEVWLAFAGQALVDPTLHALREEIDGLLLGLMRQLVEALVDAGLAAPELDLAVEAERLNAVVDGLVVHALLRPERVDPALMRAVVARHLDGLRPS